MTKQNTRPNKGTGIWCIRGATLIRRRPHDAVNSLIDRHGSINRFDAPGLGNGALTGQAYHRESRLRLATPRSIRSSRKRRAFTSPRLSAAPPDGVLVLFSAFRILIVEVSIGTRFGECQGRSELSSRPPGSPIGLPGVVRAVWKNRHSSHHRNHSPKLPIMPSI